MDFLFPLFGILDIELDSLVFGCHHKLGILDAKLDRIKEITRQRLIRSEHRSGAKEANAHQDEHNDDRRGEPGEQGWEKRTEIQPGFSGRDTGIGAELIDQSLSSAGCVRWPRVDFVQVLYARHNIKN